MMNERFFYISNSIIILCSLIAFSMAITQGQDGNHMKYFNMIYFLGFIAFLLNSIKNFYDKRIFMSFVFLIISLAFSLLFYLNLGGIK